MRCGTIDPRAALPVVPLWLLPPNDHRAARLCRMDGAPTRARLAGRSIMIVEDEVMIAVETGFTVEDAGGIVLGPFHDLSGAMSYVQRRETPIAAAVLDINLKGTLVFPLARQLTARGVPILFHTANDDMPELTREFPGAPVCAKPVAPGCLVSALARLTG